MVVERGVPERERCVEEVGVVAREFLLGFDSARWCCAVEADVVHRWPWDDEALPPCGANGVCLDGSAHGSHCAESECGWSGIAYQRRGPSRKYFGRVLVESNAHSAHVPGDAVPTEMTSLNVFLCS